MIMAILAATVRFVEPARNLLPPDQRQHAGELYSELSLNFLRVSKNKLDIRYILGVYRTSTVPLHPCLALRLTRLDRPCLVLRGPHR